MYNDEENLVQLDRARANALLERAAKLDDAVGNLQAFRSLLENLNARTPVDLPPPQLHAIEMVRAGILRSGDTNVGSGPTISDRERPWSTTPKY
jgi:hypothetical protein